MAGTLDKTFNTPDGYITTQIIPGLENSGYSVVTDSKGRSIVTGTIQDETFTYSMFITRYLENGKLDTSFANGGVIIKQYTTGFLTHPYSAAIDSDDRVVVTGVTRDETNISSMFITRYLDNGSLDTSFAGGVIIKQYTQGKRTGGYSVTIDSIGRIVVTGYTFDTTDITSVFITRYLADGNLDTSLSGGVVISQDISSSNFINTTSVSIDSIGRIVVTGNIYGNTDKSSMFITRYLDDGTLDTGFAGGVIFKQYTTGKNTNTGSAAIDSSNRIVVTGITVDNTDILSMFITRYLANGKLDTSFAGGVIIKRYTLGKATNGRSVAIDSSGRIVVTGYTFDNTDIASMFITRYLANGKLDTSFSGGVVTKQFTLGKNSWGESLAIDNNGRIVVTGHGDIKYIGDFLNSYIFIARYLSESNEPICLIAGTPILTDQGIVPIEKIDTKKHTIGHKRIVAITTTISPEKNLVCFEDNSMGINCPTQRTLMTPGHEVLYKGKLVQAKHFVGRVDGVHTVPYNGKDILYNVLQEQHGLMRVNGMVLETLHPENKVAKMILGKI